MTYILTFVRFTIRKRIKKYGSDYSIRTSRKNLTLMTFINACIFPNTIQRCKQVVSKLIVFAIGLKQFKFKLKKFWIECNYICTSRRTLKELRVVRQMFLYRTFLTEIQDMKSQFQLITKCLPSSQILKSVLKRLTKLASEAIHILD